MGSARRSSKAPARVAHGWTGVSPITGYATLTGARAVNDPDGINVAQTVISGARRTAGPGAFMPAFGRAYSDDEIAAVTNYVTARFGAAPSQNRGGGCRQVATEAE